jgi:hypothetical protein
MNHALSVQLQAARTVDRATRRRPDCESRSSMRQL